MSLLTVFSSVQIYLYYLYNQSIDFLLTLEQSLTILEDKKWHWAYLFVLSALVHVPTCHIDWPIFCYELFSFFCWLQQCVIQISFNIYKYVFVLKFFPVQFFYMKNNAFGVIALFACLIDTFLGVIIRILCM